MYIATFGEKSKIRKSKKQKIEKCEKSAEFSL
jgi:hypothetical protein